MKPCPICKNTKPTLKYRLKFNVFQCPECDFQFCPDATFNKSFVSDLNETTREKALINLRKENFHRILTSIKQHSQLHQHGLEVGPGYGWFLEVCKNNDIRCEGIEPETRFNDRYQKEGLSVDNGFFPQDISSSKKYDFIAYNDVIEHLPELKEIMKANYAMLHENGLLIINVPIQEGLIYFISRLAYRFGIKSLLNRMWQFNFHSPHLSYFNKQTLLKFSKENNFKLEDSFPLKTINLSEISDRIKQDKNQGFLMGIVTKVGAVILFPFLQLFPDTYCFVFRKVY